MAIWHGKLIRELRIKKGMAQHELAAKCGKSKQWGHSLEAGIISVSIYTAMQLSIALGVRPGIFLPSKSIFLGQEESQ